jgi:acetoin utilization protein AcuB
MYGPLCPFDRLKGVRYTFLDMKVKDVMSASTVSVSPTDSFHEIWTCIFKKKIHALPVVNKKNVLVGILTREELLEKLFPDYKDLFASGDEFPNLEDMERKVVEFSSLKVADLMRTRVVYAHEDAPVLRALSRMIVRRINQMPVVTEKGIVVGMVTKGDIFYALFNTHVKRTSGLRRKTNP